MTNEFEDVVGPDYEPNTMVKVYLKCVQEWVNEQRTEFLDIEEGMQGEDLVTFKCPECGENHKSRRLG